MDHFAVLSLPCKAALSDDEVQAAYLAQSRVAHPDHGGTEAMAAQVNSAYETLRHPERRLKHLMELRAPEDAKAWRTVPLDEALMQLFSDLGKALEASAKTLERKAKAQTALAKALLTAEELEQRENLERLGFAIDSHRGKLLDELPALDEALAAGDDATWRQAAMLQARLAYLARWQGQIRERLLQLM